MTADDIIGTKFLLLSEISGNGGAGTLLDITLFKSTSLYQSNWLIENGEICRVVSKYELWNFFARLTSTPNHSCTENYKTLLQTLAPQFPSTLILN